MSRANGPSLSPLVTISARCHWKLVFQCESGCNDSRHQPRPSGTRMPPQRARQRMPSLARTVSTIQTHNTVHFTLRPNPLSLCPLCSLWLKNFSYLARNHSCKGRDVEHRPLKSALIEWNPRHLHSGLREQSVDDNGEQRATRAPRATKAPWFFLPKQNDTKYTKRRTENNTHCPR